MTPTSPQPPEGQSAPPVTLLGDRAQPAGRYISHSQMGHECGLALKFARERQPWPFRSIALVYGTALHAGLERWHWDRDLEGALKASRITLMAELGKLPEVRWDDRLRRGTKKAAITDAMAAEAMLAEHLRAWHEAHSAESFSVLDVEKTLWIELARPEAWKIQCRLDVVIEKDGAKVIRDYKSSGKPWDEIKFGGHADQLHLYMGAEARATGRMPDRAEFHVFIKGTPEIQVFNLPFDIAAINRLIEYKVRPTIAMIEADAYVANTNWWGHSPKWCAFWEHCPMGANANAEHVA